ncbi:hypothetical protein [Bryobacter aggregatus]|uniref:hypothetical protein n=1 Tax=Bryobacter aggregatus TaxID=360054 RepID=UPI00138E426E|nr:hypothetical protein [Bryobacter aggregatus]
MSLGFIRFERFRVAVVVLAALFAWCGVSPAQPSLTSIQDMVYLADGTRFNGMAYVEWKSFDAPNGSVIGQYDKVVRIVDGLLQVKLVPTSAASRAYYSVKYVSGGRVLFTEVWNIPPSTSNLKLREIRAVLLPGGYVSNTSTGGEGTGGEGSVGSDTAGSFVDGETPAGTINGSNQTFTLAGTPSPATALSIYLNGILLSPGVDYSLSTSTITFLSGVAPQAGDTLRAYYRTGSVGTAPHNLLSGTHPDTFAESVQRGDLLVGQGATTKWMRLPLGAANRCLVSNGVDAVWNTCLFTGLTSGSIPFVNSGQALSQDNASLFWDANNKRLGIGSAAPGASLTIQGNAAQTSTPLTRWLSAAGSQVANMASDGTLTVARLKTATTATTASWNDPGISPDPTAPANGDFWYNSSQRARKSYEAFQTHVLPQVLCSVSGGSTTATATAELGSYTIPPAFFDSGDRLEIAFNFEHTGTARDFTIEVRVGTNVTPIWTRTFTASETAGQVQMFATLYPTGVGGDITHAKTSWTATSFGSASPIKGEVISVPPVLTLDASTKISLRGYLASSPSGTDSVSIRHLTMLRYPAQYNP